jgi:hypothetical protein
MKIMNILGDDAPPCITPVNNVIIAHLASSGSIYAVVLE